MMEQRVFGCIQQYGLVSQGDNVIVALSGGADSMALFHFLYTHAKALGIGLAAAHFDHGLRGEESERDAVFVREVCGEYGVPLYAESAHMRSRERPGGMGEEEWARQLRLAFFEKLAVRHSAKIATAHTRSDNAETVLFRAIRGSGPRGLAGIPPKRGVFIRPLLWVSRDEVEAYCARSGLGYVVDSTNASLQYSRNRLRLRVMPQLEQAHAGAGTALCGLAEDMRELDTYLTQQAGQALQDAAGKYGYDAGQILALPPPVQKQVFSLLLGERASRKMIGQAQRVAEGTLGALQISAQKRLRRFKGCLLVEETGRPPAPAGEIPFAEGEILFSERHGLRVEVLSADGNRRVQGEKEKKGLTFEADYDRINKNSLFRTRRPGDWFRQPGRGGSKPLKKWMNERGIPSFERLDLPLLACGSEVLWIAGHGFCEGVLAGAGTRRTVRIEVYDKQRGGTDADTR